MAYNRTDINRAANAVRNADALLITAGAGMGVDSGLPDFRGDDGFWKAYPPYRKLGLSFSSMANPKWFRTNPEMAWGFYGHRLELYRWTAPHDGFKILKSWADRKRDGYFVYTSNVDGQFQRAGFDPMRIVECHGAIEHAQCTANCGVGIFPADFYVDVNEKTFQASKPLPQCPKCGALARPNILMFGDMEWAEARTAKQMHRINSWLLGLSGKRVAIVECGAGGSIPTVRMFSQRIADDHSATLVRINIREPEVSDGHVGLDLGALSALQQIDSLLLFEYLCNLNRKRYILRP